MKKEASSENMLNSALEHWIGEPVVRCSIGAILQAVPLRAGLLRVKAMSGVFAFKEHRHTWHSLERVTQRADLQARALEAGAPLPEPLRLGSAYAVCTPGSVISANRWIPGKDLTRSAVESLAEIGQCLGDLHQRTAFLATSRPMSTHDCASAAVLRAWLGGQEAREPRVVTNAALKVDAEAKAMFARGISCVVHCDASWRNTVKCGGVGLRLIDTDLLHIGSPLEDLGALVFGAAVAGMPAFKAIREVLSNYGCAEMPSPAEVALAARWKAAAALAWEALRPGPRTEEEQRYSKEVADILLANHRCQC